jgi:hypothetical protein
MWDALSDERTGLSFTIAADLCQSSHTRVRIPRDLWPYFTVSDSRHPKPGRPGPRIYIPQEQGGPVIPPDTCFPFRRLLRLIGLRWRYSKLQQLTGPAYNISTRTAQKIPLPSYSVVTFVPVGVTTCSLLSHCLATAVPYRTIPKQRLSPLASQFCLEKIRRSIKGNHVHSCRSYDAVEGKDSLSQNHRQHSNQPY